jgi:uncharacterized membrane protein
MSAGDVFLLAVRWLHLVSGAAWVGGSLFYLLVLRPAARRGQEPSGLLAGASDEFRVLVNSCIAILVATGIIMSFNRLTDSVIGAPYVAVLALKAALSVWMIVLVHAERRRRRARAAVGAAEGSEPVSMPRRLVRAASGFNALVALGLAVFLLSDLLKELYETALAAN